MWRAVRCGLQELTEATGKTHHLQLCVQFWLWAPALPTTPKCFRSTGTWLEYFPSRLSCFSEMLSTVWKISKRKEFSANLKTMPQVGKHLRQEWVAKHQLLDSFEYFVSYFYICMCYKACLSACCLPNESPKPPLPQLWFISEQIHERQIACFQIHTLVWYYWALHHLEEIFSHLSQSSLSPHTCKTIAPVFWPLRDYKSF